MSIVELTVDVTPYRQLNKMCSRPGCRQMADYVVEDDEWGIQFHACSEHAPLREEPREDER